MDNEKLIKQLRLEDLPEGPMKEVAELTDLETVKKLAAAYGGQYIHIPQPETLAAGLIRQVIKDCEESTNKEIADFFQIGERTVSKYRNT